MNKDNKTTSEEIQIIRAKEVAKITGLAEPTLYKLENDDPTFPKKVQIGPKAIGWVKQEITNWVAKKIANRK